MQVKEFHYRLRERVGGLRPGMHRGRLRGDGDEFSRHVTLAERADPRRLAVNASARDPFRRLLFNAYRQRGSSTVSLLADVSASMFFRGNGDRAGMLAEFLVALSHSASRVGDAFAVTGWDAGLRGDLLLPPTFRRGAGPEFAKRLLDSGGVARTGRDDAHAGTGLEAATRTLRNRHSLVFIASDFLFPLEHLGRALAALATHTVVPMVLRDSAETTLPRGRGLARVRDLETGEQRTLWLRPALRERLRATVQQHDEQIDALCQRHGCNPLYLVDRFDADAVTAYFYQ